MSLGLGHSSAFKCSVCLSLIHLRPQEAPDKEEVIVVQNMLLQNKFPEICISCGSQIVDPDKDMRKRYLKYLRLFLS